MRKTYITAIITLLIFGSLNAATFAQSTDESAPTMLTTSEISGRFSGSGTYYYAFDALRNETVQGDLRLSFTDGVSFSVDFRVAGGGLPGREGDVSYMSVDNGASGTETRTARFTTLGRQRILMSVNFSGRGSYVVRVVRSGGTDDAITETAPRTKNVSSTLIPCVDLAAVTLTIDQAAVLTSGTKSTSLRVYGLVRNVSTLNYSSRERMQSVQILERRPDDTFVVVAEEAFSNLAPGEEIGVVYKRAVVEYDRRKPPVFRVQVNYADGIRLDKLDDNDDCRSANNSLTRTATIR